MSKAVKISKEEFDHRLRVLLCRLAIEAGKILEELGEDEEDTEDSE